MKDVPFQLGRILLVNRGEGTSRKEAKHQYRPQGGETWGLYREQPVQLSCAVRGECRASMEQTQCGSWMPASGW